MAEQNSWLKKFQALLDERGWRSESELTRLHKFIHFWVLLFRSFVRNRCPVRASALSYSTLLALIPLCALALAVTSSLLQDQGEERIYQFIEKFVSSVVPPGEMPTNTLAVVPAPAEPTAGATNNFAEVGATTNSTVSGPPLSAKDDRVITAQREAAKKIDEFIRKTQSGTLGVTGMVLLVFVALRMLSQIESTFNDIWGVARGRNWLLRVVLYWTTITLGPLLVVAALGLAGGPHWTATLAIVAKLPVVGPLIFPTLTLLVLWLAFALFYQLVPNTKVHFVAALVGGIVAGTLWHLINVFGYLFVSRVTTNLNIYGSLGLVPVFMAGIYLSWFILLLGAQVAYAFQNRTLYLQEKIAENVNQRGREFVALRLLTCIGQRFQRGLPPATIPEMSRELAVPGRLVQQVLNTLIAARLVTEIHGPEPAFAPARPLDTINAHHVLQAMRASNGQELVTRDEPVRAEVYGEFARIQEAEKQAAASLTMFALVNRAQARLEFPAGKAVAEEIQIKPASLPVIEPVPELAGPVPTVPASAEILPGPEKFIPKKARPLSEEPLATAKTESTPSPEPAKETETTSPTVANPRDDERDFPL